MKLMIAYLVIISLTIATVVYGEAKEFGIQGEPAPKWGVDEWLNLPDGKTRLSLGDLKGKIVYITFFQTMCAGCHQHGLPTLKQSIESFKDNPDIAFVAIQTAFERYDKNDLAGARKTADEFDLSIPVGHQGSPGSPAPILWTYNAGGTPWTIIIDKKGIVRMNQNYTTAQQAHDMLSDLLGE